MLLLISSDRQMDGKGAFARLYPARDQAQAAEFRHLPQLKEEDPENDQCNDDYDKSDMFASYKKIGSISAPEGP